MSELPRPKIVYPPAPDPKELFKTFELIGPDPAPAGCPQDTVCYRIIDTAATWHDASQFEHTTKTKTLVILVGQYGRHMDGLAESAFTEFKRRLLYQAEQEWQRACDALRDAAKRASDSRLEETQKNE
jgi:hypothetical protein